MAEKKIALSKISFGEAEIQAAAHVLKSGFLREGEKVREFEDAFCRRIGIRNAIATNSGTAALHLTYLSLLQPGDEVLKGLRKEGVDCAVHYPLPLHKQICFAGYRSESLPESEVLSSKVFALPIHPFLSSDDISYVMEKISNLTTRFLEKPKETTSHIS